MTGKRGRPLGSKGNPGPGDRKNVTIDAESLDALREIQAEMARDLGFEPTLKQTILRLVRVARERTEK